MDLENAFEAALHNPHPALALQKLLSNLLEKGLERYEIIHGLEQLRKKLAAENRIEDDVLILDLMDGFNGWCRV